MKINIYEWEKINSELRSRLLKRSELNIDSISASVSEILKNVRQNGDSALIKYAKIFDRVNLYGRPLAVTAAEFKEAEESLGREVKQAIAHAIRNVEKFHREQLPDNLPGAPAADVLKYLKEVEPGVFAGERHTPIQSAGLYVPRGRGSFPSMMIMEAVPASVAGVKRIAVATPPDKKGAVDPATLYAASQCGVTEVYRIGGAQAIAALAYGTESVDRTAKILGPGSMYIAAAKRLLYGTVDVGLPAGPSESIIIADGTADPEKAAMDLIIEAEHGSDSSAILVTHSRELAESAQGYIEKFVKRLKEPRAGFVKDVLSGYGGIVLTQNIETSIEFVNEFAPEHLQIAMKDPFKTLKYIENAGEILLGQNTPFSLANYAAGANAILPTGGNAGTYSPLSVHDFMKFSSVVYITKEGLEGLSPDVITLADYEGFEAHALALRERMKNRK
ncbi:MAG: histidinol dehydrogenase [Spirochaetales bacterium]|nr:histidinol dehydrogenase [Spirochaetales bacterium]